MSYRRQEPPSGWQLSCFDLGGMHLGLCGRKLKLEIHSEVFVKFSLLEDGFKGSSPGPLTSSGVPRAGTGERNAHNTPWTATRLAQAWEPSWRLHDSATVRSEDSAGNAVPVSRHPKQASLPLARRAQHGPEDGGRPRAYPPSPAETWVVYETGTGGTTPVPPIDAGSSGRAGCVTPYPRRVVVPPSFRAACRAHRITCSSTSTCRHTEGEQQHAV